MTDLVLGFDLAFADLYDHAGLTRLDQAFSSYLSSIDAALATRMQNGRADPDALDAKSESGLLIALAPHVEDFLAELFGVRAEVNALAERHHALAPLYACKRLFIQRHVGKAVKAHDAATLDGDAATKAVIAHLSQEDGQTWATNGFDELIFARAVQNWRQDEASNTTALAAATHYAAWALHHPQGRARHGKGVLFQLPEKLDPLRLVPTETIVKNDTAQFHLPEDHQRARVGFDLTDQGADLVKALDQANYCILCHNQGKDSCSKGLKDRKTNDYQKSPFGVTLAGCPLGEKISEMHMLKADGAPLGALAMIAVDNPLCAGTGHRICNDCVNACIYQHRQKPVDIPQVETRTLKDALELPWGFEIYSLLTRWNPLNLRRPVARERSGYKVLVVGLGPAGYTLAHHLLNDGHTVVAIDGLKIEPLPSEFSGVHPNGETAPFRPIHDIHSLYERLDERVMAGFGGVAEYGITVRWNKNFLKLIRILLERRATFSMIGGVRFGGALSADDAFAAGFDHIALCLGAGRPTVLPIENGLARGVRQASDFLMSLQLTGAAKTESIANLEVRLPIAVIGGGLTAIDTATEALAYYPVQVEKFLSRYETLAAEKSEAEVRHRWTAEEQETADEFLAHARALRAERAAASVEGRPARVQELLDQWGGSTVVYRRRLIDAPSYTLNPEEVSLAMEEGIRFLENAAPKAVDIDHHGHAQALRVEIAEVGERRIPAKTILVAAGTQPNTVLAREYPGRFKLDGKHYQAYDEDGRPAKPEKISKPSKIHILMSVEPDGRAISFFGDLHPSFAGNVVKAFGGAKQSYPTVSRILAKRPPTKVLSSDLIAAMNRELRARVHAVTRLTPNIIEVTVEAPRAAGAFQPGQFYRLQNFETLASRVDGTVLAMEGLALTGASVDREKGLLSLIVLEMGGSSSLCAKLRPGEPVILMGPTGAPTEIPENETVCLVGGGLGNAVLFSIGQACRAKGARVIYFAGYKKRIDRYKVEQIEAAADRVIWCCDEAPGFLPGRPGDKSVVGNIVQAILSYASGDLGATDISLSEVDRIIAIGSDRMMAAVGDARHTVLRPYLKPKHEAIGSINSPMQCMMKEICAQCLQLHRDPSTGEERVVFSCFNQDQHLDHVDFGVLRDRLEQNAVQEKLSAQWIDRCLKRLYK
ncbi:NADPH-dependent glutamate synthase beta subunit-like oxidoreductase [Azospirillaceae bacterium]